ncbi:MAG: hypothetical protein OEV35_03210, partial [Gallionellaceae bacterium]|nr:hypothetical protein [Gallionellaceae bacterium]
RPLSSHGVCLVLQKLPQPTEYIHYKKSQRPCISNGGSGCAVLKLLQLTLRKPTFSGIGRLLNRESIPIKLLRYNQIMFDSQVFSRESWMVL